MRPAPFAFLLVSRRFWLSLAEGEGFEPSSDLTARNGFRDRRIRPLCHPSAEPCGQTERIRCLFTRRYANASPPEPGFARREAKSRVATTH